MASGYFSSFNGLLEHVIIFIKYVRFPVSLTSASALYPWLLPPHRSSSKTLPFLDVHSWRRLKTAYYLWSPVIRDHPRQQLAFFLSDRWFIYHLIVGSLVASAESKNKFNVSAVQIQLNPNRNNKVLDIDGTILKHSESHTNKRQ